MYSLGIKKYVNINFVDVNFIMNVIMSYQPGRITGKK